MPMNGPVLAAFAAAGLLGLFMFRRDSAYLQGLPLKTIAPLAALLLICIAYTQADASWSGLAIDTDLYHAAIVRWNNTFPAVPGLAQLNVRLGTDSSFLLLASVFDNYIWDDRTSFFMGGLFTFAAFMHFVWEAAHPQSPPWARGFALCMLGWLIMESSYAIPGLYYDLPAHYINAVLVLEALRLCLKKDSHGLTGAFLLFLLAATGFCIKSIAAMSVPFAVALAVYLLWRGNLLTCKNMALTLALPVLAAVGYVGRNLIHSGYPLYPSPFFGLPLPWTLPEYIINDIYQITKNHPRTRDEAWRLATEGGFSYWFPGWLARQVNNSSHVRIAIQTFTPLLAFCLWLRPLCGPRAKRALFFMAWSLANIAFWFIMAPETRYASGFFWVFAATALALRISETKAASAIWRSWWAEKALIVSGMIWFIYASINIAQYDHRQMSLWGVGKAESRPVEARILQNGQNPPLTVWVPRTPNLCGNAPLPCTPYPEDNLKLFEPGNLGAGFYRDKQEADKGRKHIVPF